MAGFKLTYITIFCAAFCIACSNSKKLNANSIYYKEFDLFTLSGVHTLPGPTVKDGQSLEFVEVSYLDKLPNVITYHFPDRQVVLKLEGVMKFQDRNIYIYYTGNLLGGKAGKQREYSLRYSDNAYKLYVDLSDTLLVQAYDNIDARSGTSYHYMIDVYTKSGGRFNKYSLLQSTMNNGIPEDSLYKYWNKALQTTKRPIINSLDLFPPKK